MCTQNPFEPAMKMRSPAILGTNDASAEALRLAETARARRQNETQTAVGRGLADRQGAASGAARAQGAYDGMTEDQGLAARQQAAADAAQAQTAHDQTDPRLAALSQAAKGAAQAQGAYGRAGTDPRQAALQADADAATKADAFRRSIAESLNPSASADMTGDAQQNFLSAKNDVYQAGAAAGAPPVPTKQFGAGQRQKAATTLGGLAGQLAGGKPGSNAGRLVE